MGRSKFAESRAPTPSAAREEHVAGLRRVGFTEAEIFEIVMVAAYYALRCRMADGLGVELDPRAKQDPALVAAFTCQPETGQA